MPDRPLPTPQAGSPKQPAPDAHHLREATAIHAYEHAAEAQQVPAHRLDVVEAPARRWRRRIDAAGPPPVEFPTLTHAVESPTGTAFKLGFGFSAGVAAFRLIMLAIVVLSLLVAAVQLFDALFG